MIVASLGSDLARAHAEDVRESLASRYPGEVELHPLVVDDLLGSVLAGKADVAVHRMEHLDAGIPEDLTLAALLPRRSFTDALVADAPLRSLPRQARIGTSNVRRRALLLRARPDLQVLETHADVRSRIQQWRVGREMNRRIKKTFDARGIEIPFPHQTLYWGVPKHGTAPPLHIAASGDGTSLTVSSQEHRRHQPRRGPMDRSEGTS